MAFGISPYAGSNNNLGPNNRRRDAYGYGGPGSSQSLYQPMAPQFNRGNDVNINAPNYGHRGSWDSPYPMMQSQGPQPAPAYPLPDPQRLDQVNRAQEQGFIRSTRIQNNLAAGQQQRQATQTNANTFAQLKGGGMGDDQARRAAYLFSHGGAPMMSQPQAPNYAPTGGNGVDRHKSYADYLGKPLIDTTPVYGPDGKTVVGYTQKQTGWAGMNPDDALKGANEDVGRPTTQPSAQSAPSLMDWANQAVAPQMSAPSTQPSMQPNRGNNYGYAPDVMAGMQQQFANSAPAPRGQNGFPAPQQTELGPRQASQYSMSQDPTLAGQYNQGFNFVPPRSPAPVATPSMIQAGPNSQEQQGLASQQQAQNSALMQRNNQQAAQMARQQAQASGRTLLEMQQQAMNDTSESITQPAGAYAGQPQQLSAGDGGQGRPAVVQQQQQQQARQLTPQIAQQFLQQTGGDKDAARALARQNGFSF